MSVNVTGVFLCTKHAIPYLKKSDGASIVYLASDEAKFVTGSELVIDGGCTAQ